MNAEIIASFFLGVGFAALIGTIAWMLRRIRYLESVANHKRRKHEDTNDFWEAQAVNVKMRYQLQADYERLGFVLDQLERQAEIIGMALNRDTKHGE